MHPHGCTQIRHEHQTNSHWEYKQGLLVLLTSACVKPITGHLEHGPLVRAAGGTLWVK